MESNKAYELYRQTKNEEYIKIISDNAHGIARKYINEGRKKGCVYFMDEERAYIHTAPTDIIQFKYAESLQI